MRSLRDHRSLLRNTLDELRNPLTWIEAGAVLFFLAGTIAVLAAVTGGQ